MSHRIDDCELGDWDPGAESSGKRKEENRPLLESGPDSTDSLEGSADPHTDSLSNVDFNAKLMEVIQELQKSAKESKVQIKGLESGIKAQRSNTFSCFLGLGVLGIITFCAGFVCADRHTDVTIDFPDLANSSDSTLALLSDRILTLEDIAKSYKGFVNVGNSTIPIGWDCKDFKCDTSEEKLTEDGWYELTVSRKSGKRGDE